MCDHSVLYDDESVCVDITDRQLEVDTRACLFAFTPFRRRRLRDVITLEQEALETHDILGDSFPGASVILEARSRPLLLFALFFFRGNLVAVFSAIICLNRSWRFKLILAFLGNWFDLRDTDPVHEI